MSKKIEAKELLKRAYDAPNEVKVNYCLVGNGYPVEEFMINLEEGEQDEIISLFELLGVKKGKLYNKQKFKKLQTI